MKRILSTFLFASLLATSTTAHAEPRRHDRRHWYGWELMLADAGSLTSLVGAAVTSENATAAGFLGVSSIGLYAIAPPAIHFAHDRPEAAAGSFGLRLGVPLTFGLVGYLAARDDHSSEWVSPKALGALAGVSLGYFTAMILDWSLLAYEPAHAPLEPDAAKGFRVMPTAAVTPNGAQAGLVGTF